MRTTEEILAELDARFSNPISPVRAFASTPLAPPPPDPPEKKPKFEPRPVKTAQPKATKAARQARIRRRKPCTHEKWHRVRGSDSKVSCARCREIREVTSAEQDALCPQRRPGGVPKPIRHGTRTGYMRGCRCEACSAIERHSRRERYQAWKETHEPRPKTFRNAPENCEHPRWWKCTQRPRLNGTIAVRVQCRTCGIYRTSDPERAKYLCSGEVIPPSEAPKKMVQGTRRYVNRHGSHAMYRKGCRCEVCFEFHSAYKRQKYREKMGREAREYRKAA